MFHSTFFPVGSFQLVKADQRFKEIYKFHLKSSIKDSVALETYFYELYVSGHNFLRDKLSVGISVKTLRKFILFPKKCLRDICLRDICLRELILFANKCLRDLCLREFILFAYKSLRDLCLKEVLLFGKICLRVFCLRNFCLRDFCHSDCCLRGLILFTNKCLRDLCLRELILFANKSLRDLYLKVLLLFSRCVSGTSVSGISASGTAFSGTSVPGNSFSLPTDISGNTCQKSQGIKVKSLKK